MGTRAEAQTQGLARYFTGEPCKNGHIAERYTSKGECVECVKNATTRYRVSGRHKISQKKWRDANPDNQRERQYLVRYGLSLEGAEAMKASGCGICGAKASKMHIDHCHETGELRGALCSTCNTGLGKLGDNEEGLLRALDYLRQRRGCEVVSG